MKKQQIRVTPDKGVIMPKEPVELSGWLSGRGSYLWFGHKGFCIGTLSGHRLYRLAKAIVRHYEADR